MSFKIKLLELYHKYDLNPTSLSRKLGYKSSEKISRLTRDEKNLPSYDILCDLAEAFPDIESGWFIKKDIKQLTLLEEPEEKYSKCHECIKKDGVIEFLKEECARRGRRIEELESKYDDRLKESQTG
jgi:hypothetical protein